MHKHHNVLLIQADQWPWFCLGILGNPNVRTPHLDALVRTGGILFDNDTAQSPICLPSRISMLTGCYVSTTRQPGFSGYCCRNLPWMPDFFKEHGYITGAFGKFHSLSIGIDRWSFDVSTPTLGEDEDLARPRGDHYRAYCEAHGIKWPTDQMHGHDPHNGINLMNNGRVGRVSSHADPSLEAMEQWAAPSDVPEEHSLETWTTDRCMDFLRTSACEDKPFFVWASYDRPHYPTTLPPEWYHRVRPEDIQLSPLPSEDALSDMPMSLFQAFDSDKGISRFHTGEQRFRELLSTYFSLIEWIDEEIGRLIATLDELKLRDSTIIVFTTDHGDQAGRSGLFDKTVFLKSEAITRVPLIIAPPSALIADKNRGRIVSAPVENVDVFPTLAALCGLDGPAGIEGRDLSPLLAAQEEPDAARSVFCEDHSQWMVKQDGWRLAFGNENGDCLLHNLNDDPEQWNNLYRDDRYRRQRISLKRELLTFHCQRIDGPCTEFDIRRMRKGLDNDGTFLPALHDSADSGSQGLQLFHYRSALLITDAEAEPDVGSKVLVPFYSGESILLWNRCSESHRDQYLTRDRSLPEDLPVIEALMDRALQKLMQQMNWISILTQPLPNRGERPDQKTVHELVSRIAK